MGLCGIQFAYNSFKRIINKNGTLFVESLNQKIYLIYLFSADAVLFYLICLPNRKFKLTFKTETSCNNQSISRVWNKSYKERSDNSSPFSRRDNLDHIELKTRDEIIELLFWITFFFSLTQNFYNLCALCETSIDIKLHKCINYSTTGWLIKEKLMYYYNCPFVKTLDI